MVKGDMHWTNLPSSQSIGVATTTQSSVDSQQSGSGFTPWLEPGGATEQNPSAHASGQGCWQVTNWPDCVAWSHQSFAPLKHRPLGSVGRHVADVAPIVQQTWSLHTATSSSFTHEQKRLSFIPVESA